jgi:HSP20 family molecular chaperone IbpA
MANLDRCDAFGDSFEESFRRNFAPARRELPGAPTDIKVDVQETEQARAVKAEIAGTTPRATRVTVP